MKISFVLAGAPRTKKTHGVMTQVKGFDKVTGKPRMFNRMFVSEEYRVWFKAALKQGKVIRRKLIENGVPLPFEGPVAVKAMFYREANIGDIVGFEQAVGDAIQEPLWKDIATGRKKVRSGIGIIKDDRQIEHWDGSRRLIDRARPRIEVTIETLAEPGRLDLG